MRAAKPASERKRDFARSLSLKEIGYVALGGTALMPLMAFHLIRQNKYLNGQTQKGNCQRQGLVNRHVQTPPPLKAAPEGAPRKENQPDNPRPEPVSLYYTMCHRRAQEGMSILGEIHPRSRRKAAKSPQKQARKCEFRRPPKGGAFWCGGWLDRGEGEAYNRDTK